MKKTNYIYDLLLNFQANYYDFYEWNEEDNITHIRKIPSFKVSNKDFKNLKNKIIISKKFLDTILKKTQYFNKNNVKNIKYASLFSNGKDIIAIKFNKNGENKLISTLSIEEQDDIIEIIKHQKETPLEYKLIKKIKPFDFKTRFELENEHFIKKELSKIYSQKDYKKLNYIHLECFGTKEINIEKAIKRIKKEITKGNDNFYKIFNIFKITAQK